MNDKQKTAHRRTTSRTRNILTRALIYVVLTLAFLSVAGVMWPIQPPVLMQSVVAAPVKRDEVAVAVPTHKRRRVTRRRRIVARKPVTACCCPQAQVAHK